jgi:hypothetical protein
MRCPKAATPAPAAAGNRCQGVSVSRLDTARLTQCDIAAQYDLTAHIVAVRYGLAPHIATLIASLAGLGGGQQ